MPRKTKNIQFYEGVGRRKEAVARVRLYIANKNIAAPGKASFKIKAGEIYVNQKPIEQLFPSDAQKVRYLTPLKLTNNDGRFAISIVVKGGGRIGQLEAIMHGMSRALQLVDRDMYRPILKKQGLLMRDPRTRERRKVGTGGKARREKQSPKR
ncbi:30S ribosomal protein S9 [Candidatus Roizmanbacteria bacterium]|nr:30S ribosomal protein S9 [Candidatus Roizmanbacteria bacterium]